MQILDLSGKFLETKILQILLKPDDRVQRDLRATEPSLTIRRPVCIIALPPSYA